MGENSSDVLAFETDRLHYEDDLQVTLRGVLAVMMCTCEVVYTRLYMYHTAYIQHTREIRAEVLFNTLTPKDNDLQSLEIYLP